MISKLSTFCWEVFVVFDKILQSTDVSKLLFSGFKVPLLWIMKGSYFGFGSPQQQVDMHAK